MSGQAARPVPIDAGQGWTSFHGAMSAARAPDFGKPLIDDLSKARPLWRSEAGALCCWGNGADARYRERAVVGTLCGGSSTPVVAGGRVYLYHYRPSGDGNPSDADAAVVEKYKGHPVEQDAMRRWYSKTADVVVTCLDGATGKTVWQTVCPRRQGNSQTHKWRGLNPTPAVAGGVIVAADYSWGLHAFDAKSGDLKWSRGGAPVAGDRGPLGPVIAGGAVVFATEKETLGLDLATGKQLWKAPGGHSARRMVLGEKERVLLVGSKTSSLVDATPGRFTALGREFRPLHNDTTAYGVMALSNVVVDGRLIVRGMDGLYCYDLRRHE